MSLRGNRAETKRVQLCASNQCRKESVRRRLSTEHKATDKTADTHSGDPRSSMSAWLFKLPITTNLCLKVDNYPQPRFDFHSISTLEDRPHAVALKIYHD